jgi:hypothetical protein
LGFWNLTKWPQNSKWRLKNIFLILLSNFNFQPLSKNLTAFEASFYYLTFIENNFFSKIQYGGFFKDDVIFEKKSTFFKRVVPTLNSTLFKSQKSKSVVKRPMIYQKIYQRKFSKMADIFKMAFVLFSCMKICLVTVISVLSSSFLACLNIFLCLIV